MPRYFFNVYDCRSEIDNVGVELASLGAARRETVRFAGEVLSGDSTRIYPGEDWRLEVADEAGLVLFRLDVTLSESSALKR